MTKNIKFGKRKTLESFFYISLPFFAMGISVALLACLTQCFFRDNTSCPVMVMERNNLEIPLIPVSFFLVFQTIFFGLIFVFSCRRISFPHTNFFFFFMTSFSTFFTLLLFVLEME